MLCLGCSIVAQEPQDEGQGIQSEEISQSQEQEDVPQPLSEADQLELMKKMGIADLEEAEGSGGHSGQETGVEYGYE
jgi:hypothetical protein